MKNILKKIGVFGLICAVLSPFIDLPKVNADDDCKHYLNQYLFLDEATVPEDWVGYEDTYNTFTTFAYTFPVVADGQTIRIDKVGAVDLNENDDLIGDYQTQVERIVEAKIDALDSKVDAYKNLNRIGGIEDYTYKYKNEEYESKSIILHGYWGYEDEKYEKSDYENISDIVGKDDFYEYTVYGTELRNGNTFDDKNINLDLEFSGASLSGNKFSQIYSNDDIYEYFDIIVNDVTKGYTGTDSEKYNYVVYDETSKSYMLNLGIERHIDSDDLEELHFGTEMEIDNDGTKGNVVWSTTSGIVTDSLEAWNNYELYGNANGKPGDNENYCSDKNKECYYVRDDYDIDTAETYYWPVILNVEYSICSNASDDGTGNGTGTGTGTTTTWKLTYNANGGNNDVTNMPTKNPDEAKVGESIAIPSTKPSRSGYSFKQWCTNKDGSGDCYNAGKSVTYTSDKTLYAIWGPEGTTENPKQGVVSYIIGFAAVGLVAGTIYLVSKKKNLFKQI